MMEPSGARRNYSVEEDVPLNDSLPVTVKGSAELLRTDRGVWVQATLSSRVSTICSRCLRVYDQPIEMLINDEFLSTTEDGGNNGVNESCSPYEHFHIDQNHLLDLTEATQQYAVISMSMKPMCTEDCPGICFTCGTNLVETSCQCNNSTADPRWSKLLDLALNKTNTE